ncbi:hypothetical protein H4S02_007053 [Coemansia sp. RSA 2611]|nr:hypothetical protein H4S02_007053 [Coemansia sp. RSA 2611]
MSPAQNGAPRPETSSRGRPRLGSAWTQPAPSPQLRAQEPGERDGSKMRKPSFWSIFRGGSQRKEHGDDKGPRTLIVQVAHPPKHGSPAVEQACPQFASK